MPSFPTLSSGYVAKYPLTRGHTYRTTVLVAVDGTEQRFSKGSALEDFTLTWTSIRTADKNLVRDFFNSRKGAFDTTWDITLPAPSAGTWTSVEFAPGQDFVATEYKPGYWQFSLKIRTTRKQ